MKTKLVVITPPKAAIYPSPGFAKKGLADYKLDILALCGFGCRYCSSNSGNYLRINREKFADATEQQLGERMYPSDEPSLSFVWPNILDTLERQIASKDGDNWGEGQVLVFSMLTDGFSPAMVKRGFTAAALRMVLERTRFRVRILTKNAIVGAPEWIEFFRQHRDRVVVGLSIGTLDDDVAKRLEIGTSTPSARLKALRRLQEAGVPTYGMLCPVFPDVLEGDRLVELVDRINPKVVEDFWAEPYNDRFNWRAVRDAYPLGSRTRKLLTRVYLDHAWDKWSKYATRLYVSLRDKADREGWLGKLHYLLYEDRIAAKHADRYSGLRGVLLQSKPGPDGMSKNPLIAALQAELTE